MVKDSFVSLSKVTPSCYLFHSYGRVPLEGGWGGDGRGV